MPLSTVATRILLPESGQIIQSPIFDGVVMPPDHEPRESVVEMVNVNSENPKLGSEVRGEVQLRNSGKYSIKIPWSADSNTIERAFPVINPCQ